LTTLDY